MSKKVVIGAKGLRTYGNQFNRPDGSTIVADNVVVDRDGVYEKRRGFVETGSTGYRFFNSGELPNKIFPYKTTSPLGVAQGGLVIFHGLDGLTASSADGTLTYSNSNGPARGCTIQAAQANQNLYYTTNAGIKKIDSITATSTTAGGQKAIDIKTVQINGVPNLGWMPAGTRVAYRYVICKYDANNNLIIGAPSGRKIVNNPPAATTAASASVLSRTSSVTTATFPTAHQFQVGDPFVIVNNGSPDANFDNPAGVFYTVASVPTPTTLTFADSRANANSAGSSFSLTPGTQTVQITISLPAALSSGSFIQIYRSEATTIVAGGEEPSDELRLVYQGTAFNAGGDQSYTDMVPEDLRGATGYFCASQEGILQSNDPPPLASDITAFKDCLFLSNTTSKQRLFLNFLGVNQLSTNSTRTSPHLTVTTFVTAGSTTCTCTTAQTHGLSVGQTFTVGQTVASPSITAGTTYTIASTPTGTTFTFVCNASSTATSSANNTILLTNSGLSLYDSITITRSGTTYTFTASPTTTDTTNFKVVDDYTSPTVNLEKTAYNLVNSINSNTSVPVYAFYYSGSDDTPGQILLEERSIGGASFTVTASNARAGSAFNPVLPTSGTTVFSTNEVKPNRLYFSKTSQPEAFPVLNYIDVGAASQPILRIFPLRESLFIFKTDGVYRLTGSDPSTFSVTIFDSTAWLLAPDSCVSLGNQIICLTNQGVVAVSETGVSVLSHDIEDQIRAAVTVNPSFAVTSLANASGTLTVTATGHSFQTGDWVTFLTSDSTAKVTTGLSYQVRSVATDTFVVFADSSVIATSSTANTVTRVPSSRIFGVGYESDRRYLLFCPSTTAHADPDQAFIYNAYSNTWTRWNLNTSSNDFARCGVVNPLDDKLYLGQTLKNTVKLAVERKTLTSTDFADETAFGGSKSIVANIQFAALSVGDPTEFKQFREIIFHTESALSGGATVGFYTDLDSSEDTVSASWSTAKYQVRASVPPAKWRGNWLVVRIAHSTSGAPLRLSGLSIILDNASDKPRT